ncbi:MULTISPECIES: nickel-responsive transcriptional regulator NikR [Ramlibacter]|uniref:Putative nickel-responsive regulator n=1 Tax=Ramlibacter pinisoli TaxID=2682844 RepID=A0A6N8IZ85_9BURK|nr:MULTISPECIES: nickel-responsive transcriptional regulator NikR [Ramlibacter]MBA2961952.1 nickel-responsive transcriptional regulator NikR [Ramlibacter sp. CGMCC 1.13660]MVQ31895.1 nickel-responsive transcriptional regulator NikR [Ramlibacter pinisoli]
MQRLTISVEDDLAADFETLVQARGYENRSEAFRDLLRRELGQAIVEAQPDAPCVATLTYLYDHHERTTANRLADMQHDHHDLTVSTMHAHLGHHLCVETAILRGPASQVQAFAQQVLAQRGVRQGNLHLVPLDDA